jgi:hypothetical protein
VASLVSTGPFDSPSSHGRSKRATIFGCLSHTRGIDLTLQRMVYAGSDGQLAEGYVGLVGSAARC